MSPEKRFENRVIAALEDRGWFARHFDAPGLDGWPDILALKGSQFRLIEVKSGTRVSASQKAFFSILWHNRNVPVYLIEEMKDGYMKAGLYPSAIDFPDLDAAIDWVALHG